MRFRFLAIGLIAGLLAACTGGGADPKPTPSPSSASHTSTAPSSPASPTRTGPLTTGPNVRPGDAPPQVGSIGERHDDEGATVFGAYYFRALDWVIATNDDALVRQIALPTCHACTRVMDAIKRLHDNGEREVGGRIRVKSAVVDDVRYQLTYDVAVRVTYDEDAVRIISATNKSRTTTPSVRATQAIVFLAWRADRWRVVEVSSR